LGRVETGLTLIKVEMCQRNQSPGQHPGRRSLRIMACAWEFRRCSLAQPATAAWLSITGAAPAN